MPLKPLKPCNAINCNVLTRERYCDQHKQTDEQIKRETQQRYDKQRGSATERGYDSRWQRSRKGFLAKHPLCECSECTTAGRLLPATVVDHRIPHKGDKQLFWDRSNWQAMSKRCHDRKTAQEDGGWGRGG